MIILYSLLNFRKGFISNSVKFPVYLAYLRWFKWNEMFRNLQIFPSFDFLALTKHIQVHNVMAISCFILNSQLSTENVSLKGFVFEERKCRSEHSKSTVFWKILRSVCLCEISTYIMIYKCWNHPECENQSKYCTGCLTSIFDSLRAYNSKTLSFWTLVDKAKMRLKFVHFICQK